MSLSFKRKEAKTVTFTIKDDDGDVVDCSSATFTFEVKANLKDSTALITISDDSFNKSNAASGVVTCVLTTTHLNRTGAYKGELKIQFAANDIDKSETYDIIINKSITD